MRLHVHQSFFQQGCQFLVKEAVPKAISFLLDPMKWHSVLEGISCYSFCWLTVWYEAAQHLTLENWLHHALSAFDAPMKSSIGSRGRGEWELLPASYLINVGPSAYVHNLVQICCYMLRYSTLYRSINIAVILFKDWMTVSPVADLVKFPKLVMKFGMGPANDLAGRKCNILQYIAFKIAFQFM